MPKRRHIEAAELARLEAELAQMLEPCLEASPSLRRLHAMSPALAEDATMVAVGATLGKSGDVERGLDRWAEEAESEAQSLVVEAIRELLLAKAIPPLLH